MSEGFRIETIEEIFFKAPVRGLYEKTPLGEQAACKDYQK